MFSFLRSAISKARQEARIRASQAGSSTTGLILGHRASRRQYARRSIQPGIGRYQQRTVSEAPPSPTRKRSFLLDPPTKPESLRASPSRELPFDASPFERRLASNPYAFLTKLIQAAPAAPGEKAWIVPEGIIPNKILRSSNSGRASDRFGTGRWVFSGSNITEKMIKEGQYKMINPSAFVRPNLARLVYAQWTIRVASDMTDLCKAKGGPSPVAILKYEVPAPALEEERSSASMEDVRLMMTGATLSKKLQCVLYFGPPRPDNNLSVGDTESKEASSDPQNQRDQPLPDITQPSLPTLIDRSRVLKLVKVHSSATTAFTVPMYDMEQLFHNHPNGLRAIQQACTSRLFRATPKDQIVDRNPRWIGLTESPSSVSAAMGLWKLAFMLPKTDPAP
ncbi:hypothetical protein BGX34_005859 [Mortierella sp. NVP85]|nr:hypothetical protein BGX34_005859 [Mortierella sp. NVP85]